MKKYVLYTICVMVALMIALPVFAGDIEDHPNCSYCNMSREKFSHSRMLVKYADGTETGICSIRDAALDMAVKIDSEPVEILVSDYNTKELLNAENAVWVLGGSQKGVMTKRAKWAFKTEADAEAFIKEHGGEIVDFEAALKAAYEDMFMDTNMIRMKRQKMKHGMKMKH